MSEIMLGVLNMPDDLFWDDDPMVRIQHNEIRKAAAQVIAEQAAMIELLVNCINTAIANCDGCSGEINWYENGHLVTCRSCSTLADALLCSRLIAIDEAMQQEGK